jgi:hypothetical protein
VSKFPGIPEPEQTLEGLYATVLALKESVETLTRQRDALASAVTWDDLLNLRRTYPLFTTLDVPRR